MSVCGDTAPSDGIIGSAASVPDRRQAIATSERSDRALSVRSPRRGYAVGEAIAAPSRPSHADEILVAGRGEDRELKRAGCLWWEADLDDSPIGRAGPLQENLPSPCRYERA